MAVPYPSYLDALIEGLPPVLKAASAPQHKYTEDPQNVGEYIEKLFGRLSVLLFHIDKQINKVLIQGRLLPKKIHQWAMEARALKRQVSDLLQKQQSRKIDSLNSEELVEVGIKMINHLKKCPCKDEMMYDKPLPFIIHSRESDSHKRLEQKYNTGEKSYPYFGQWEQTVDPVEGRVLDNQDAGTMLTSAGISSQVVEPAGSDFASISKDNNEKQSAAEITEEDMTLEDSKTKMSGNMLTSVCDVEPHQAVESETESTSSKAERSKHHEEQIPIAMYLFLEEQHYSISLNDNHIKLELDHQTILIENCQSSTPPDSSLVNHVLNLVEQDLRELPEKPEYQSSLVVFLQRNYHLTLIHSSFFESMPDLHFLDLSDSRIRILPSSLFRLPNLKVLLLRNCVCLEKLSPEIEGLRQMEVLDLSGTELYNLPDEINQLTLLKHMQMSFYGPEDESEYDHLPSKLFSPNFLSNLKQLQALSITVHPEDHRWTAVVACIIEDVSKLEMLSYLQFYFPEVEMYENYMSSSWNKNILSKFNFIVGHNVRRIVSRVPNELESLFDQQDKCLKFVNGDKVSQLIKTALTQVTAFYLDHHIEIQSLSEFGTSNFQALKFCVVRECPKIQSILDEKKTEGAFPCLEHLGIFYLWELKHIWKPASPSGGLKRIWKTPVPSGNFKALKYLTVNTCPKLQFVLGESMLQCLSNLEELVVEDCERVEKIVKEDKRKVRYSDVILPRLRKLLLHYLPQLVSLGNGICLPPEKVDVYGCPKLILKSLI